MTCRSVLLIVAIGVLWSATARAQEQIEYYGSDAIGSTRIVFDQTGAIKARADFRPFGEEIFASAPMPAERFTGQVRDGESASDYFHARMLQPRNGRFNAVDPVFAAPTDPQQWNRYAYARGNPLSFVDPLGAFIVGDADCQYQDLTDGMGHLNGVEVKCFPNDVAMLSLSNSDPIGRLSFADLVAIERGTFGENDEGQPVQDPAQPIPPTIPPTPPTPPFPPPPPTAPDQPPTTQVTNYCAWHYYRNVNNVVPRREPKGNPKWSNSRLVPGDKYRSSSGSEAKYDESGALLYDNGDNFTYNYAPSAWSFDHFWADVLPTFICGQAGGGLSTVK